ncbi:hypothetical protein GCM10009584_04170 [Ornithinimicrobium humiphilum]|uniref:HNH endonuclease n=1 Tax=Ornithinimicrobium humiphilum TaxID=125288 RepID=A0A543K7V3_9MICO|nr:HNH endonuclease signature motif containing protein [Ornithinimicrobium humiphilum]TQM91147.1 hypothetical protein FB476_2873 [Ornithinimicrobium humiphilum]
MSHKDRDAERAAQLLAALAPDGTVNLRRLRSFVPAEWAHKTSVGLDGVIRIAAPKNGFIRLEAPAPCGAHPALDAAAASGPTSGPASDPDLTTPPLREVVADQLREGLEEGLEALAPSLSRQPLAGEEAVGALETVHGLSSLLESARLHAARELAARTAEKMLRVKGVTSPDELSPTARERWRARAKSVTAAELATATGMGLGAARTVVAIATAPDACARPVQQALDAGIARWELVAAWWRRCTHLPHESGAEIARTLFGMDVPLGEVAPERLTPDGELSTAPWAKKQFLDALEREVRRQEGADPLAQRARREAQHRSRDAYAVVDDDGSAQLVVTGDAASVTACVERLHTIAVRARREGDPRGVPALRSDAARALLLHGTLPLPALGEDADLLTPDDIARLVDVISGTPAHELHVVVPWDVLAGHAAVNAGAPSDGAGAGRARPSATPGSDGAGSSASDSDGATASADRDSPDADADADAHHLPGVARVLATRSTFLTADEVRRIAGRPGTTIYRLLTDPADGRCLERSLTRYSPDRAMRAQLRAADVMSRAPGSTLPSGRCDLDHVEEYLLGGRTTESNLQSLDRTWHALKTEKFWDATMDESRNVTWESFWGRPHRTRVHDYRQYLGRVRPHEDPSVPAAARSADVPPGTGLSPDERRHLASLLVYAALAHRDLGARLEADDDDPEAGSDHDVRDAIWLRCTRPDGRRTTGPRPGTPSPETMRDLDPRAVLDSSDWTTLGTAADGGGAHDATQRDGADGDVVDGRWGSRHPGPPPF